MKVFRSRGAAALAIIATLSLSASPASARDRHDWGRHHRHRGGIDAGSLLAGLLVGGAAVAIATSANRNSNTYSATIWVRGRIASLRDVPDRWFGCLSGMFP